MFLFFHKITKQILLLTSKFLNILLLIISISDIYVVTDIDGQKSIK